MTEDPFGPLATALDGTSRLVAGVRDDQWNLPTPCPDWTVRQLVNHLVGGQRLVTRVLHGEPLPPPDQLGRRAGEHQLGADPTGAYRTTADEMLAAFRVPGVLDRAHTIPAGTLPGPAVVHIRIVEALVHGWDLAMATGQVPDFPDKLVEVELGLSRGLLARLPEGRHPFGPSQPVADDAPAIDRLAALLGRAPAQTGGRSS